MVKTQFPKANGAVVFAAPFYFQKFTFLWVIISA